MKKRKFLDFRTNEFAPDAGGPVVTIRCRKGTIKDFARNFVFGEHDDTLKWLDGGKLPSNKHIVKDSFTGGVRYVNKKR